MNKKNIKCDCEFNQQSCTIEYLLKQQKKIDYHSYNENGGIPLPKNKIWYKEFNVYKKFGEFTEFMNEFPYTTECENIVSKYDTSKIYEIYVEILSSLMSWINDLRQPGIDDRQLELSEYAEVSQAEEMLYKYNKEKGIHIAVGERLLQSYHIMQSGMCKKNACLALLGFFQIGCLINLSWEDICYQYYQDYMNT